MKTYIYTKVAVSRFSVRVNLPPSMLARLMRSFVACLMRGVHCVMGGSKCVVRAGFSMYYMQDVVCVMCGM